MGEEWDEKKEKKKQAGLSTPQRNALAPHAARSTNAPQSSREFRQPLLPPAGETSTSIALGSTW